MVHRRFFLATLLATAVAAGLSFGAAPALAANPVTYAANDTAADTPGAPDIAGVVVSDTTQGLITFQINFVPGTEQPSQDSYGVYIDSDQNPTTGDLSGAGTEYLLLYDGTPGGGLGLYKWDGKSAYQFVSSASLKGSLSGDSQYFVIAASELGITDGFNFNVAAGVGSDPASSAQSDSIPENASNFHYSIQSKAVIRLSVSDWETSAAAHAGRAFFSALAVRRSDTGAALTSGATIQCTLTVAGKRVPVLGSGIQKVAWYKGKPQVAAACIWRIPAGTVGARLVGKETVTLGTSTVSKSWVLHVHK
jgi:hypothetical protein